MTGRREEQGGGGAMMKGIWIHPESMCCFLCSLQSNKNGHGKRDVPLFFFFVRVFRINFPFIVLLKLETWKTLQLRALCPQPSYSKSDPLLDCAPNPYLAVRSWSNTEYKTDYFTLRVFFFLLFFQFQAVPQNKKMLVPEQCVKVKTILSLKWFQDLML